MKIMEHIHRDFNERKNMGIKEINLKDLRKLINRSSGDFFISVDLTSLTNEKEVSETTSETKNERGREHGRD